MGITASAFVVALALYGIACGLYLGRLAFGLKDGAERAARIVFALAFAAHSFEIAWQGAHGQHPGASVREATSFAAWLLAGAHLLMTLRWARARLAGAFVAPVVIVLEMGARLTPDAGWQTGASTLGRVHIALAMAGVAVFMAATAAAVVYLMKARTLKSKKRLAGTLARHGLPLDTIDAFQHRLILIGFPIFTMALITGAAWVAKLPGGHAAAALRPEYPLALVTWISFALLLGGRAAVGWHGRRTAWLTLVGFGSALLVLSIYALRRVSGA